MSDFERRREKNKEARELVKIRRENIAKYFFDLSKLTFAALVLGLGGAFFNTLIPQHYSLTLFISA